MDKYEGREKTFVLNVSRDKMAAGDLRRQAEQLRLIGNNFPAINQAAVLPVVLL